VKRTWIRIALWSMAGLLVLFGALLIVLWATSPSTPEIGRDEAPRDLPTEWLVQEQAAVSTGDVPDVDGEAVEPAFEPFESQGRLALIGDGEAFGEETYTLSITEGGAELVASGRLWFKVLVARIVISFEQTLTADARLRPGAYVMTFDGPLGFNRSMSAVFEGDRAVIERDDGSGEIVVSPDRAFVVGTFSTYALVPRLFAEREQAGQATLDLMFFGGPPNQETASGVATGILPTVRITRAGRTRVLAGDTEIVVDRYLVLSGLGTNELFARGDEFLAFRGIDEEEGTLLVYRSDYFPNGIEFVDD